MKPFLETLGRTVEFESCFQVLDVACLTTKHLRQLNNFPVEIRASNNSLTGFELIVRKHPSAQPMLCLATALALALAFFI